jgi:hypothetical protein
LQSGKRNKDIIPLGPDNLPREHLADERQKYGPSTVIVFRVEHGAKKRTECPINTAKSEI